MWLQRASDRIWLELRGRPRLSKTEPSEQIQARLPHSLIQLAHALGDGNFSAGARRALLFAREHRAQLPLCPLDRIPCEFAETIGVTVEKSLADFAREYGFLNASRGVRWALALVREYGWLEGLEAAAR